MTGPRSSRSQLATFCLTLAAASLGACTSDDPVEAVRAFDRAAESGRRAEVFHLLGPQTRARLEDDARRAGELSGRRTVRPEELLAIGWSPRRFHSHKMRVLSRAGDHAEVEVEGPNGEREVLSLVRAEGAWRIELP
jgi:hypothetical protein